MTDYVVILGFVAGLMTTFSAVPQIVKAAKTKSTGDLSLAYIGVLDVGTVLWMAYGLLINSLPLVVWNVVSFSFASFLVFLKLKYK